MPQNDEFLYNLRNANPIETVMGGYVNVIRRGRNYVCSCPFHSEKTPSCTIFTDTQNFYCFGCGAGGDVITFIMKIENLTFPEAVKLLAQRAGLEVPAYGNKDSGYAKRKTRIYEMNRIAANFYYTNLFKGKDKAGLQYFANRKLTPQTIKKYGLGYASDSWNELTDVLRSKGYSDDEMADAWLAGMKNGRTFDMFRMNDDGTTPYFTGEGDAAWFGDNACRFGFIVRYPEGKDEATGEKARTYTYRYVGAPHASYMHENGLCFEEYIAEVKTHTKDDPLTVAVDGVVSLIYYVPASEEGDTDVTVPKDKEYTVSGNNFDGFIVTVKK